MRSTKGLLRSLVVVLVCGPLALACSSSSSSTGASSSSDGGSSGGSTGGSGGGAKAPASTVSCTDVCNSVEACGVDATSCANVCPKLSLACQGCLAKLSSCNDACIQTDCGNLSQDPKPAPQPATGQSCDALTFDFADHAPTNDANAAGGACTVPWDCRSQACISGKIGTELVSFCANEGDCVNPDPSLSDPCPQGWKCVSVPSANTSGVTRSACVPPDANVCAENQLSR